MKIVTASLFCLALLASALPATLAAARPNVILLESDDHHFQALGCMGDPVRTPNLDRLAARGVLFRNNICQGTACAPSRNSLLTGSYPHNTGVFHNQDGNMPAGVWTLPAALQRAGYTTALVGKNHFKPPSDYTGRPGQKPRELTVKETHALGFDFVHSVNGKVSVAAPVAGRRPDDDPYRAYLRGKGLLEKLEQDYASNRGGRAEASAPSVLAVEDWQDSYIARQAAEWIRDYRGEKPFFMWVDFVTPHPPADPPEPYASEYDWREVRAPLPRPANAPPPRGPLRNATDETFQRFRASYYAMITALDAQIGGILDALEKAGQLDHTLIVFTGDQGSMLGDLGLWGKGVFYKGSINSPLIIAGPGVTAKGSKVDRPVELLDVTPTLLELAGASDEDRRRCFGQSLTPLLTGREGYTREAAFAEEADSQMVADARYKYVRHATEPMLFDLENDPNETSNLAGTLPEVEKRMSQLIDDWHAATPPVRARNPSPLNATK